MSPNMVGALVGLAVGLIGYMYLRLAASRVESNGVGPEPEKTAKVLRTIAFVDLVVFVIAGYFVGPMIVSNSG